MKTRYAPSFTSTGNQHFTARAGIVALCDPEATMTKRHRFLIFVKQLS